MMYYSLYLLLIGPTSGAALKSLLSKCVGVDEFGKLFTISTILPQVFSMALSTAENLLYKATLDSFPDAIYVMGAANEYLMMILTLILYFVVKRHERAYGEVGKRQNAHLTRNSDDDRYKGI